MSGLNTKDVKVGGGLPKTLQPGNQVAKINSVQLEEFKLKAGAYNFIMHMEGPDLGKEFDGFMINKDDASLGKHAGQVGRVKSGEWAFADGTTKTGIAVSRDQDIMKFMKSLCMVLGEKSLKWFNDADGKYPTIETLVEGFNKEKPFKDVFLNYCIAGKEYEGKNGYTQFDLYLPKFIKGASPFEAIGVTPSKLIKYDEATHLKKKEAKTVQSFAAPDEITDAGQNASVGSDFEL